MPKASTILVGAKVPNQAPSSMASHKPLKALEDIAIAASLHSSNETIVTLASVAIKKIMHLGFSLATLLSKQTLSAQDVF